MISDYPKRTRILIVAIITAVFVSSLVFAYIMLTDGSVAHDDSRAIMYAAVFAIILIVLNALLLTVALQASRKAKAAATSKKCASCGAVIHRAETECPECGAVQVNSGTYLDPKAEEEKIRPKKKR
ncbi:MAG: hypothetical protein LBH69_01150 [Methanomassiliicoccaceae archaeon]|jgi:ribosomal protein L32|nr:hypothetical protein [Methanomassiliicoccaceae archaeon]